MGFFRHHAIVVTCDDRRRTDEVREKAYSLGFHQVSNVVISRYEQSYSFFVAPDGAKEGLDWSTEEDERRDKLIAWFVAQSNILAFPFDWVELEFGGDTQGAKILRHQDSPEVKMDSTSYDPALFLNRSAPDPLSPAVPITIDTPCPRCGAQLSNATQTIGIKETILSHCDCFAIEGDDTWVNANACENGDPLPFLKTRLSVKRGRSVSV
jgi:hypothetical protein